MLFWLLWLIFPIIILLWLVRSCVNLVIYNLCAWPLSRYLIVYPLKVLGSLVRAFIVCLFFIIPYSIVLVLVSLFDKIQVGTWLGWYGSLILVFNLVYVVYEIVKIERGQADPTLIIPQTN